MLLPLLCLHLLLRDHTIGSPPGKFIYYIGLILAFFGDILLIRVADAFFLGGMIAFIFMHLLYGAAFWCMYPLRKSSILPTTITLAFLAFIGYAFYRFLEDEMGNYKVPILVYMITVSIMVSLAMNVSGSSRYRKAAVSYLIPGVLVFLAENILVAANKFHYHDEKGIIITAMFTYGLAQYLIVKGIEKVYL